MPARKSKTASTPEEGKIFPGLQALLAELEQPASPRTGGPGRPAKNRAKTTPVILHLYTSHIQWLDDYAAMLRSGRSRIDPPEPSRESFAACCSAYGAVRGAR